VKTTDQVTRSAHDGWVPGLVLFGGFLAFIGWVVGVSMLWSSPTWSVRSKLLGTLLFPGGLFSAAALMWSAKYVQRCRGDAQGRVACSAEHVVVLLLPQMPLSIWWLLVAVLAVVPVVVAVHLERVRRVVS